MKKSVEECNTEADKNKMLESVGSNKAQQNGIKNVKPDNKVPEGKEKEIFYNSKGYFIQVSGNDEKKKQKNDNFDHHDMKKNNSIFSMLKFN